MALEVVVFVLDLIENVVFYRALLLCLKCDCSVTN